MSTKLIASHKTMYGLSEPGDFCFDTFEADSTSPTGFTPKYFLFVNPACKFNKCEIRIKRGAPESPIFGWDGNTEAPTITPSIGCDHRCGWHGHITNGVILP